MDYIRIQNSTNTGKRSHNSFFGRIRSFCIRSKDLSHSLLTEMIRGDQVNFLVYGPDRPYFKQKQKNNITKFWPTGLF